MSITYLKIVSVTAMLLMLLQIIMLNQQLEAKTNELLEAKKVVLQLDEGLTAKEEMIISLNEDLDMYYMYDKIVKDLRWSK